MNINTPSNILIFLLSWTSNGKNRNKYRSSQHGILNRIKIEINVTNASITSRRPLLLLEKHSPGKSSIIGWLSVIGLLSLVGYFKRRLYSAITRAKNIQHESMCATRERALGFYKHSLLYPSLASFDRIK